MSNKLLLEARNAHATRTGHKHIFIGMNFIECLCCGKHAHLTSGVKTLFTGQRLLVHDANHKVTETIDAEDF